MNSAIDTTVITCPGGGFISLMRDPHQNVVFLDKDGILQSSATEAMTKLFDTIKANGSGKPPTIGRVDA